ncbi:hypothetical protein H5P28_00205 [Ruficoccus amylovorans]|uniref:Uncharacterized protein n=1 Tax=Ruficoccus amylovorans TaxID=1804625 RepID=A0A842H815_9BACT|nr:hypothetical protein [Ruficoccus amylovorans]MBC2592673.1 hypothetical protein [Ruficoccus amylovorans]
MISDLSLIPAAETSLSASSAPLAQPTVAPLAGAQLLGFAVPAAEAADFLRQPLEVRIEVRNLLTLFTVIHRADRKIAACKKLARETACSWKTLYRKYCLYVKGGQKEDASGRPSGAYYEPHDWRCLLKRYSNGGSGLPEAFVEYLVNEYAKTTREKDAFRSLHQRLELDWLKGVSIPGYGTADEWYAARHEPRPCREFLHPAERPRGWSYENLLTVVNKALPRAEHKRAAQGHLSRSANHFSAQLRRDRSQLLPFQLLTMDDVRLDLQALMFVDGRWQVVYVEALFVIDVATGYILAYGLKGAATRGEDTEQGRKAGTKMSINGRDVRHIVLQTLRRTGLAPWPMTLLCEGGTAKLDQADEVALLTQLTGRFDLESTGKGRGTLLKSGFREEWGMPHVKGWVESLFRKVHTMLNHLPATTGRRYDLSRGDLPARIDYTKAIIARAEKLVPGPLDPRQPIFQQLRLPVLTVDEVNGTVGEMVHALNWRINHKLQGFDQVFEWRDAAGQWRTMDELNALPPEARTGIDLHARMEAPAERLQRLLIPHMDGFERLPEEALLPLYLEKRLATVNGARISIQAKELSTEPLRYRLPEDEGLEEYERREKGVLLYLDADLATAHLTDATDGSYLCALERELPTDMTDQKAILRDGGAVHREREAELDHVRAYLTPTEEAHAAMREHNEDVLEAATVPGVSLARAMREAKARPAPKNPRASSPFTRKPDPALNAERARQTAAHAAIARDLID